MSDEKRHCETCKNTGGAENGCPGLPPCAACAAKEKAFVVADEMAETVLCLKAEVSGISCKNFAAEADWCVVCRYRAAREGTR